MPIENESETGADVALIGAGVMGEAILVSLIGAVGAERIRISDGRAEHGAAVAQRHGVRWCATNTEAVDGVGAVIIAVKPKDVGALATEIDGVLDAAALVVSIAAGIPTAYLESRLGGANPVVRVMPNTPATIGHGVSVLSAGTSATADHLDRTEQLLAGTGTVLRVDEAYQDVVTGISGSGPAYVFYLIDALAEAGVLGGLSRDVALDLARATVAGSGAMALASGEHPAILRERVSSPAGTTVAGVRELDERGVRAAVIAAVDAARARSVELGRDLA
ncbi:pyrroline-5-carboxylate reductase [Occultella kanbiaonis]|uniref:pyrroline-5-carboxylate reductase n=1 Tax=Occultella kanbiaonis TaxID=2675754 RepID=UPI001F289549|nr:pyrroline-5-carboxylate reductase [Occultella kanbiaonis]